MFCGVFTQCSVGYMMGTTFMRVFGAFLAAVLLIVPATAQNQQAPKRKKILAIGEVKGFQHDSVSHALASIEKWGKETGLWDTYIRTDSQLLTKQKPAGNAKNLDYFDAVVFYTTGELDMNDQQKKDLMSFIKDDGKGFIGVHSATDTFYQWPEYGEMIGGWFDQHPWGTFEAPILVEDKNFPGDEANAELVRAEGRDLSVQELVTRQRSRADAPRSD